MREMMDSGIECIGAIPASWEIIPLRYLFSLTKGLSITKSDLVDEGIPVISYGQIHAKDCDGVHLNANLIRCVPYDYPVISSSLMKKGDVAFADTSEDLEGMGNAVFNSNDFDVYAGYHTILGHSIHYEDNRYFGFFFKSIAFKYQLQQVAECVKVYSISQRRLKAAKATVPPLEERVQIADYLDSKCYQIDEAIRRQESIIEKLEEYRQSVITETVTKGLDPNAEMKDSGVAWIGMIPKEYTITRLKYLLDTPLEYGANESGLLYNNNLPRYIRITDILNTHELNNENKQSLSFELADGYMLTEGDLLFARSGATVGKAFFVTKEVLPAAYAGYLIKAKCNERLLLATFLAYFTESYSYYQWIEFIFSQATIRNIGADKYANLWIPLPPVNKQQEIVEYLNSKCAHIDKTIRRHKELIEKLNTYRQSLIYEVVTGKKEVV